MLNNIKIILVHTSHPGNIGATARAMKTMGFSNLVLVAPKLFPHPDAIHRATGANDILENATVVDDLKDAIKDCEWVIGASVRERNLGRPIYDSRDCAKKIIECVERKIGIVFGRENNGLSNEELSLCHAQVNIPTNPLFSSLNLASAVQVICYEILMCFLSKNNEKKKFKIKKNTLDPFASADQVVGFYEHLRNTLILLEVGNPKQPKKLMQRLQLLFNRTQLTVTELNILRGILKAVNEKIKLTGQNI